MADGIIAPNQLESREAEPSGFNPSIKPELKFDSKTFFSRYLCGNLALQNLRSVSRYRTSLVAIGEAVEDVEATALYNRTCEYRQAVKYLSQCDVYSADTLKIGHSFFKTDKLSGEFRYTQNWIGPSRENATYVPPAHTEVIDKIDVLISFINHHAKVDTRTAKLAYLELLTIHPFDDANGRFARALLESLLPNNDPIFIHPSLYRLGTNTKFYAKMHYQYRYSGTFSEATLTDKYWVNCEKWAAKYQEYCKNLIAKSIASLEKKINYANSSNLLLSTLALLINNPIVTERYLAKTFSLEKHQVSDLISTLIARGILTKYRTRTNEKIDIYVSDEVMEMYHLLDQMIFKWK